jgi:cholesterol transport system auxiliary component
LRISAPVSAAGLNTARMVYSTEPKRLDYFAYHEWAAPPAKMLASLLEKQLDASGMFNFVVTNAPDIRADLRLDSNLLILQQNFKNASSNVQLAVKVSLSEPGTRTLVASQFFSYEDTAESADAESGVDAANRAVGQFVIDLEKFIQGALVKAKCSNHD